VVGVPLIVALASAALSFNPAGSAPGLIDQLYGALPPAAVQLAVYRLPTTLGPAVVLHFMVREGIGMIVPLKVCVKTNTAAPLKVTLTV